MALDTTGNLLAAVSGAGTSMGFGGDAEEGVTGDAKEISYKSFSIWEYN